MAAIEAACRVGIDVGGTFTDFVLADGRTGAIHRYKEPSVPDDPSLSVERGLPALIERAGISPGDVGLIVHGTTLGLNAIIQRRGARLGLVVSKGQRGILEIGRGQLANAFSFALQKEPPLVPRRLVLETGARLLPDGRQVGLIGEGEIEALATVFRTADVDAVTVMLMHAYALPEVEKDVADRLRAALPGVAITESSTIWPERREYERCLVALLNAYIQPLIERYLDGLQRRVTALGVSAPIYITANNGGTLSLATARARPIDTILSGPASGVVAASITARPTGYRRLVTIDMGGTSADMSVTQNGEPEYTTRTHVGELPVIVPVVSVSAIGAGGGSIVRVDAQGVLKIGPDSAGAEPGPVCYGKGGTEPTITDCYLLTGFIHPDHFLGGRMPLDRDAARRALETVADRMGISGEDRAVAVAEAALRVATATMATEIEKSIVQRGESLRDYALVAFGGAGPTQANLIAADGGMATIIVPAAPSTFCALGAILADVKRDFLRSVRLSLDDPGAVAALHEAFAEMEHEAGDWVAAEGSLIGAAAFERSVEMRYADQAYDLAVPVDDGLRGALDATTLAELYHRAHEVAYSYRDADSVALVTTVRLRVVGRLPEMPLPAPASAGAGEGGATRRPLRWGGRTLDAAVHLRRDLAAGASVTGPAIIEQEDTTILVLDGWIGQVDDAGNVVIRKDGP